MSEWEGRWWVLLLVDKVEEGVHAGIVGEPAVDGHRPSGESYFLVLLEREDPAGDHWGRDCKVVTEAEELDPILDQRLPHPPPTTHHGPSAQLHSNGSW